MIDGERLLDTLQSLGFDGEFVEDDTEIRIACPQCADDNKRLYIEAETGCWLCFRCDERGDLFALFNEALGLGAHESFEKLREVRFRLGPRYSFTTPWIDGHPEEEKPPGVELPEDFIPLQLDARQYTWGYRHYLQNRGISPAMQVAYGMGFCIKGPYAGRVIIPVYGAPNHTLYTFVARSIDPGEPRKVLYPPHSRPSETLFNLDRVVSCHDSPVVPKPIVLVEGVFDALRLPARAIAILGSSLSATQMGLLGRLGTEWHPFVVCMDGDPAGQQASFTIMRQLWGNMLPAVEALLPADMDPSSAPSGVLLAAIHEALEKGA